MKKAALLFLVLLSGLILAVSTSNTVMEAIFTFRNSSEPLKTDKYYYGDLFGMSYLPRFKMKLEVSSSVSKGGCDCPRSIHLFIAGDSYLGDQFVKSDDIFCGVGKLGFLRVNFPEKQVILLDTTTTNILLVETVERGLRFFKNPEYLTGKLLFERPGVDCSPRAVNARVKRMLFNEINRNLEFNLFSYSVFTPIKELKASLNYRFFKRISGDVCIAPDSSMLLYLPTVDSLSECSSFFPIADEEIDSIVQSLNDIHRYYTQRGFDEVYFSMIPNPVSVLYPGLGTYNELIPRLQCNSSLKMPLIDAYDLFRAAHRRIYFDNDTHWNMNGFTLWLNECNKKLERHCSSTAMQD